MNETLAICMAAVFIVLIVAACCVRVEEDEQETERARINLELSKVDRDILRHQRQIEELKKENLNEKEHQ